MTRAGNATAIITTGTRLAWDGEAWTVTGIEAGRLVLRNARGKSVLAETAAVLADPSTRLPGTGDEPGPAAFGPLLDSLTDTERGALAVRLRHVRELLTGFASGTPAAAEPGEPRPEYDPALPLAARYQAKAAELGVSVRTLERWVAALRDSGPAGIADGRSQRGADPLGGVDERWLAMCRLVLGEHTGASRPTKELVLHRVSAPLAAEHGEGTVREPGRRRAHTVLAELSRGTNAFAGSTRAKRSIAARPQGVYGRLRPARPGEYLLLDTTPLDVFAMEPVTLRWVRCELTIAMDLYSRAITGLRLSPVSTKSVDAALVLFEALRPGSRQHTSGGLLPYAGLPDLVVAGDGTAGLAGVAAETVVVDHGKIYLSDHLLSVCQRLGISVQPARPLTPTDKAAVERFFRTLSEGLLAALPGYKGSDVYSRGADPEGCAYFFTNELEQVVREWIDRIYHQRPHAGLAEPQVPGLELSPAEMLAHGTARAGRLKIPAHPGMVFDFLPVAWRTVQHYGVEVGGLRYNGPALTRYRNKTSPFTGAHAGRWPVRYDTDDVSRIYFQDPAGNAWHELSWEHAQEVAVPFSAEALAYARRLVLAEGRHVDERRALAGLLERWDAGLVRHPAERRMAIRASQQRAARMAGGQEAIAEVAALPSVAAVTAVHQAPFRDGPVGGDDDSPGELDPGDEDYYADAFGVLP
jgi:transposase InsO family protein